MSSTREILLLRRKINKSLFYCGVFLLVGSITIMLGLDGNCIDPIPLVLVGCSSCVNSKKRIVVWGGALVAFLLSVLYFVEAVLYSSEYIRWILEGNAEQYMDQRCVVPIVIVQFLWCMLNSIFILQLLKKCAFASRS